MVPPFSNRISRVPPYSSSSHAPFHVRGYHPLWRHFPEPSTKMHATSWATPRSLAATYGISVDFFSYGYLDVSVPRVRLRTLCIQVRMTTEVAGFPHSDIPGSKSVCRLPEAFRRLPRPSSPLTAKASTMCAYSLDHITPNSLTAIQRYTPNMLTLALQHTQHRHSSRYNHALLHPVLLKSKDLSAFCTIL